MKVRCLVTVALTAIIAGLVVYWRIGPHSKEFNHLQIEIDAKERREFLEFVAQLPTQNEFFSDVGVNQAIPYARVLLAVTKEDEDRYASERGIKEHDIYPLMALSAGMAERPEVRAFVNKNFSVIQHPRLKLMWGALLFDKSEYTRDIVVFLHSALDNKSEAQWLSGSMGPGYDNFKARVEAAHSKSNK